MNLKIQLEIEMLYVCSQNEIYGLVDCHVYTQFSVKR